MATTFWSGSVTNTQEAPLSFMQVLAQALWAALAPLTPQELSLIQPVQVIVLLSAMVARLIVASSTASRLHVVMTLFISVSSSGDVLFVADTSLAEHVVG